MTVIDCTDSFNDPGADAPGAGWRAYYPGTFDESGILEGPEDVPVRRIGVLRIAGIVLVICALLSYLVLPLGTFTRTHIGGRQPSGIQPIPVAPEHKSVKLQV